MLFLNKKSNPFTEKLMNQNAILSKKSDTEWEVFLQLTQEMACIIGINGEILFTNNKFAKNLGYSKTELIKKPVNHYIHPEDFLSIQKIFQSSDSILTDLTVRWVSSGDNYKYLSWNIAKIDDSYFCVVNDLTYQYNNSGKISDGERRLKKLVQCGNERLDILSVDGKYIYTSLSTDNILGFPPDSYLGRSPLELIHPLDKPAVENCLKRILSEKRIDIPAFRYIDAKGNWLWVETTLTNMVHDPDINGIVANSTDTTSHRLITEGNKSLAKRLTNVIENFSEGYFTLSKDWKLKSFNSAAQKLVGIPKEKLLNANFWELFPGHHDLKFFKEYSRSLKENRPVRFEEYYPSLQIWVEINAYPYEDSLTVFIKDITELKAQQLTLKLEKEVLEMKVSSNYTIKEIVDFFLKGLEGIYRDMLTSVLVVDKKGKQLNHLSAPSLPSSFYKNIDGLKIKKGEGSCGTAAITGDIFVIKDIYNHPFTKKYISFAKPVNITSCWSLPVIGSNNKVLATFGIYYKSIKEPSTKEIEAIQRVGVILQLLIESNTAEVALQNSNERYKLATSATNDAIWDFDLLSNELFWGDGFHKLFGYSTDNSIVTFETWSDHIHPSDKKRVLHNLAKNNSNIAKNHWKQEYRYMRADGTVAYVRDNAFVIRDKHGNPIRITGALQDITKQREDLERLKNSEENYKLLFSDNPVPMLGYDVESLQIIAVNNAAIKLYGYSQEEFLTMNLFDIRPASEHAHLKQTIDKKAFLTDVKLTHEWVHLKKDKSTIDVELVSHLIGLNGKKTRLVAITDITEKKRAKMELTEQNQQLREIAQISSHDIRGPVASILGLINLFDQEHLNNEFNREVINWLNISAQELDQVIHTIVQKTWNEDFNISNSNQ
ncbi:MAG: domain S-box protein [Daejeonella sp.]|nr:domain S-box protein [Daejeonella sp.]